MKISKRHLLNYSILVPYLLLSILGLIVVYSTTSAILIEEGKSALNWFEVRECFGYLV